MASPKWDTLNYDLISTRSLSWEAPHATMQKINSSALPDSLKRSVYSTILDYVSLSGTSATVDEVALQMSYPCIIPTQVKEILSTTPLRTTVFSPSDTFTKGLKSWDSTYIFFPGQYARMSNFVSDISQHPHSCVPTFLSLFHPRNDFAGGTEGYNIELNIILELNHIQEFLLVKSCDISGYEQYKQISEDAFRKHRLNVLTRIENIPTLFNDLTAFALLGGYTSARTSEGAGALRRRRIQM